MFTTKNVQKKNIFKENLHNLSKDLEKSLKQQTNIYKQVIRLIIRKYHRDLDGFMP